MGGRRGSLWLGLAGLAAGSWWGTVTPDFDWRVGAALALIASAVVAARRTPAVPVLGVVLCFAALGSAVASARSAEGVGFERAVQRARGCSFSGRVVEQAGGLGTIVAIQDTNCSAGSLPEGSAVVEAERPMPSGAALHGWGWFTALGDDGFARARRQAGARALLIPTSIELIEPRGFWGIVATVRSRFRSVAASSLSQREAALLLGLTIGDTSGFSTSDLEAFRASGLAHLLAVSGSNVAIVLGAVAFSTRGLARRRRLTLVLAAAVAFVAIVGPDGSVLRAAVMGTVALLAGGWIRPVNPAHALPFALLLLIAARPSLVTSAGLHLSAAATLGIVLWSRRATEAVGWLPAPIAAVLGVTCAAQAGVAPLLVLLFERLSLVAPVSNVLAAPAVAIATLAGMTVAVLAVVAPGLAAGIAPVASPPLRWILFVADTSASAPWAEATLPRSWGWVLGALVATAAVLSLRARPPVVSTG